MIRLLIYLLGLICLSSCGTIMSSIYGLKEIKNFSQQDIDEFYADIDFENIDIKFELFDSVQYENFRRLGKSDQAKKDLSQPVQIHYYGKDSLESFHANCYAKGSFKNLDWNYEHRFESFIPKSALLSHQDFPTLSETNLFWINLDNFKNKEGIILVFWTTMLESISKDAIIEVIENLRKFDKQSEFMLYVINTDKFFMTL